MTYWLTLFNPTTWEEFLDAGATVSGFPDSRWKTVQQIQPGDISLAYLSGKSCWIAALEVTSEPYQAHTSIWRQAIFPCRVNVQPITVLSPGDGIPALTLAPKLTIFDNLKHPNWGLVVRSAPRKIPDPDGKLIQQAILEQATSRSLGSL
jgi:predicted RNA-binding protein